eukprot:g1757.t1
MSARQNSRIKWRVEVDKSVVCSNFERRGWQRCDDDSWNVFWAGVHTVRAIFNPESGLRLGDHQLINHFPNHYELTRKDLMVKNIKRYCKDLEKELFMSTAGGAAMGATSAGGAADGSAGGLGSGADVGGVDGGGDGYFAGVSGGGGAANGGGAVAGAGDGSGAAAGAAAAVGFSDFVPVTYVLPADYSIFVEEFRRNPNQMWIMKPTGKAQGKGIFIINKLSQIRKWANNGTGAARWARAGTGENAYVISRYIEDPLLVGGKKFDLRLYVLVTSFRPLRAFLHRDGFARFCNVKYSADVGEMDNAYIHLTNVAVQKHNDEYNRSHGGKWHVENLRLYLRATRGEDATAALFDGIRALIVHSLRAVQSVIVNDRHCFEVYGYDVIVDAQLKPWLVEVNASPSFSATTMSDRLLKSQLISDVLDLAVPLGLADRERGSAAHTRRAPAAGAAAHAMGTLGAAVAHPAFEVLCDELLGAETERAREVAVAQVLAKKQSGQLSWR